MGAVPFGSATPSVPSWQLLLLRWRFQVTGAWALPNRTPRIRAVVIFVAEAYLAVEARTRAMTTGRPDFSWREDMTIGWVVAFRPLMARQVWRSPPLQSRPSRCSRFPSPTKMRTILRLLTLSLPPPLLLALRPLDCCSALRPLDCCSVLPLLRPDSPPRLFSVVVGR